MKQGKTKIPHGAAAVNAVTGGASDKTNRCVKVCRRIDEIAFILSLNEGRTQAELENLRDEIGELENELAELQPAD